MLRYYLCVGDSPDGGGEVLDYSGKPHAFLGFQVALIGGRVFCSTCTSVGHIIKTGGPRRFFLMGDEMALDGDLLMCKCPQPRIMRATRQNWGRFDDLAETNGIFIPLYDEQVVAISDKGPLIDYPFRVECDDGRVLEGRTNTDGALPRVATKSWTAFKIYWGDEALARATEVEEHA